MKFTYCKGWLIGDGDVELTWVDGYGYENEAPLKIEYENLLDYPDDQEEVYPKQDYQTIQQPVKV